MQSAEGSGSRLLHERLLLSLHPTWKLSSSLETVYDDKRWMTTTMNRQVTVNVVGNAAARGFHASDVGILITRKWISNITTRYIEQYYDGRFRKS